MKSLADFKKRLILTETLNDAYRKRLALAENHTPTPMPARDRGLARHSEVDAPPSISDAVRTYGRPANKKR